MGISSINTVSGATDRTFEFASPKPASDESVGSTEKSSADIAKFDNEMTATDREVTSEFLQKTITNANKQLLSTDREFTHSVHKKTGQFMVKLIDRKTKEVIREIPPEKTLDMVAKLWELAGIFVDEKK